jgi:hypothetical protein
VFHTDVAYCLFYARVHLPRSHVIQIEMTSASASASLLPPALQASVAADNALFEGELRRAATAAAAPQPFARDNAYTAFCDNYIDPDS